MSFTILNLPYLYTACNKGLLQSITEMKMKSLLELAQLSVIRQYAYTLRLSATYRAGSTAGDDNPRTHL